MRKKSRKNAGAAMPVTISGKIGAETELPTPDTKLWVSTAKGLQGPYSLRDGKRGIHHYGPDYQPCLLLVPFNSRSDPWAAMVAVPIDRVFCYA